MTESQSPQQCGCQPVCSAAHLTTSVAFPAAAIPVAAAAVPALVAAVPVLAATVPLLTLRAKLYVAVRLLRPCEN